MPSLARLGAVVFAGIVTSACAPEGRGQATASAAIASTAIPDLDSRVTASAQDWASYLAELSTKVTSGVTSDLPTCPSNAGLPLTYLRYRDMSDALRLGARTYPFVVDAPTRDRLLAGLRSASAAIRAAFSGDVTTTTYTSCYGGQEYQTAYEVAAGLYEVNKIDPDPAIGAYVVALWGAALPMFQALGHAVAQDGFATQFYDGFGQYLKFAAIAGRSGADAYQGFTVQALQALFAGQTLDAGRSTCKGEAMTYGSWPHSPASDCTQYMGYHRFITEGLIELYDYLTDAGACSASSSANAYWKFACDNIPSNLLAAIAFIDRLQQPSGAVFEWAPGSNPGAPTDGTFDAQEAWFRTLVAAKKMGFDASTQTVIDYSGTSKTLGEIASDAVASVVFYNVTTGNLIVCPEFLVYASGS